MRIENSTTVQFRSYDGQTMPCVNVKSYTVGWDADAIMEETGCNQETAEKVSDWIWDSSCESFWECWQGDAETGPEYFPGRQVSIECHGRSGGWLCVKGLPESDELIYENDDDETGTPAWTPELVNQWAKFEQDVTESVKYHCSWEYAKDLLDANPGWTVDDVNCPCCGSVVHPSQIR